MQVANLTRLRRQHWRLHGRPEKNRTSRVMTKANITYRRATSADLTAICTLGQEVNMLHHAEWPSIFAPPSDPARDVAHWRQGIEGEGCAAFVAEAHDEVIGFVTITAVTEKHSLLQPIRYARINSVYVTRRERGKGIGRHLMAMAETWAVDVGAVDVRLNVWEFNADAVSLYRELGYGIRSLNMGKSLA